MSREAQATHFWSQSRTSFLYEMRLGFALAPRWKVVSRAEHHESIARYNAERLPYLSRPAYHEATGFATDRRPRAVARRRGGEVPYAWTPTYWRAFGKVLRHSFLAGFYGAMPDGGGEHHRYDTNRRSHAIITGLTA